MPEYKLTYFSLQALGEPIRFLFHYGKKNFEDIRLNHDDWPKYKASYQLGKLPILEVDGKPYSQSIAICRYVAKEVGLNGKNALEDLEIDGIVDTIVDLRTVASYYYMEKVPESKENKKTQLFNETLPTILNFMEQKIKENDGYLALKRLTWADVVCAAYINLLTRVIGVDILNDRSTIKALVEKVNNLPGIKEYIAKRPQSEF